MTLPAGQHISVNHTYHIKFKEQMTRVNEKSFGYFLQKDSTFENLRQIPLLNFWANPNLEQDHSVQPRRGIASYDLGIVIIIRGITFYYSVYPCGAGFF
ncbi:hypothetical protein TNCT_673871 [Trichonephila clavata]|uniref:Uncharacterized protein n=1 Tax=Trichonephila clavata TaxID=2740835 RepID=A0A8X6I5W8_TRICU|nr:hypothetical protein TNCT_673871 [Trichonephila clavata]